MLEATVLFLFKTKKRVILKFLIGFWGNRKKA